MTSGVSSTMSAWPVRNMATRVATSGTFLKTISLNAPFLAQCEPTRQWLFQSPLISKVTESPARRLLKR